MKKYNHMYTVKYGFIRDSFIDTADQNYIACRTCFLNRIDNEMSWQAAHAIEKYMKAILLIKDISVLKLSHNLLELHENLLTITKGLLLDSFNEDMKKHLEVLQKLGSPDSRYGTNGHNFTKNLIKNIDLTVFVLRRLYVQLSRTNKDIEVNQENFLDRSLDDKFRILDTTLDNLIYTERYRDTRDFVLVCNNYFAPKDYVHSVSLKSIFERGSLQKPLLRNAVGYLAHDQKIEFINWVKNHIKIKEEDIPKI